METPDLRAGRLVADDAERAKRIEMETLRFAPVQNGIQVAREAWGLPHGKLGRAGAGLAGLRVRHGGAIAQRPHVGAAFDHHRRLGDNGPALVVLDGKELQYRARGGTSGPDERRRLNLLGVGGLFVVPALGLDRHGPAPRVHHPGVQPKGDASRLHPLQCVGGQTLAQLGQDALPRMDDDDAQVIRVKIRVIGEHPTREIVERPSEFRPRKPAPGNDEGQPRAAAGRVRFRVGRVKGGDHGVANPNGVAQRFEVQRMFTNGVVAQVVGNRPQRQDEMVVGKLDRLPIQTLTRLPALHADTTVVQVDVPNPSADDPRAAQAGAQRAGNVRRLQAAGGDFGEHRREQQCVGFADQRELHQRIGAEKALQLARGADSGEPAAEDEDSLLFRGWRRGWHLGFRPEQALRDPGRQRRKESEQASRHHPANQSGKERAHPIGSPLRTQTRRNG